MTERLIRHDEIVASLSDEATIEDYEIRFNEETKVTSIFIRSGKFSGVEYQYQKVTFDTDKEEPVMHFQYVVLSSGIQIPPSHKLVFENAIAHVLYELLIKQIEQQEVIYTGGTDQEES